MFFKNGPFSPRIGGTKSVWDAKQEISCVRPYIEGRFSFQSGVVILLCIFALRKTENKPLSQNGGNQEYQSLYPYTSNPRMRLTRITDSVCVV